VDNRISRLAAVTSIFFSVAGAAAQCSSPLRIREYDCLAGDRAGWSVGIDGDSMITGSILDDGAGKDSGAAHVFVRSPGGAWKQQAKLQSVTAEAGDLAGSGVAIVGDDAFVGMPFSGSNGFVCQYRRSGDAWEETALLVTGINESNAKFGSAVAAHGNWLFAGAPYDEGAHNNRSGEVSIYKRVGEGAWQLYQRTYQEDGLDGDRFGAAVAVWDGIGLVGAPDRNAPGAAKCGSVTLFYYGGRADSYTPPDAPAGARFGSAVAVGDDYVVIGAPDAKVGAAAQAGAIYVYQIVGSDIVFKQKLSNGSGNEYKRFGAAVAIAGTTIFAAEANNGKLIRFDLGQDGKWAAAGEIIDPDQPNKGHFGAAMASDGQRLVIGDDYDDYVELSFADAGAAYVVTLPPPCPADTDGNGLLDLFDFLGFQNLFVAQDPLADLDCTGSYDFFDFLAYQNIFSAGCN